MNSSIQTFSLRQLFRGPTSDTTMILKLHLVSVTVWLFTLFKTQLKTVFYFHHNSYKIVILINKNCEAENVLLLLLCQYLNQWAIDRHKENMQMICLICILSQRLIWLGFVVRHLSSHPSKNMRSPHNMKVQGSIPRWGGVPGLLHVLLVSVWVVCTFNLLIVNRCNVLVSLVD